jgi:hypothetical protein
MSILLRGEQLIRIRKVLTFSNAIALIALFVALGGTVYAAGKISGSQIKPKSVPGNRIKPGTLTGTQIKAGSLTGKQVVGSSLTGVSASSLASVQYAVAVISLVKNSPTGTTGSVACPAGTKVIGGGALVSSEAEDYVNDSSPTADRAGWTATGYSGDGSTMTITAICAAVATTTG